MICKVISRSLTAICFSVFAVGSFGATLDFSGVQGNQGPSVSIAGATISNLSGGDVLVGASAAGQFDGFCFVSPGFNCEQDGEIVFDVGVSNLTFDIDGAQSGDIVDISAFNGATLLGTLNFTADGLADFSSFGTVTRLFFDDSSTAAGVGYSTFLFDEVDGTVPEPGTLALLMVGILALVRRRPAGLRRQEPPRC